MTSRVASLPDGQPMASRLGARVRLAALVALLGLARGSLASQSVAGVALQEVVDATLAHNSEIRRDALRTDAVRGQWLARQAPFDLQMEWAVQQDHDRKPLDLNGSRYAAMEGTTYRLGVARQLRSGISISPNVQVASSRSAVPGTLASGTASAALDVGIPLLYNRGGGITSTSVQVAALDVDAQQRSARATVSQVIGAAANAYWAYLAAAERLTVQRDAESRAHRLLDETGQLVEKEERAPADLQPLRATVASRTGARILAEQAMEEARAQLGLIMGLDAAQIGTLGRPETPFPAPAPRAAVDAGTVARLQHLALERRSDLAAARLTDRARAMELDQYRRMQSPRLDLDVVVGYEGVAQGARSAPLLSPLYHNVPGLNLSVQLGYAFALANSGARGQTQVAAAAAARERLAVSDAQRQTMSDVEVALHGVDRSAAALLQSDTAVALFRNSVDNEQRKLRLGMNTLFDVLNAEDALTNALLTAIGNRRAYAVALVSLGVATGTAIDAQASSLRVDAARLLGLP